MAQYDILTGLGPRRKIRQSDIIRAEAPEAKRRYFADRAFQLSQDALEQDRLNFERSSEFQRKEAERNAALQREQLDQAEQQAMLGNTISTLGLAKSAYPYAKKGVSAISNLVSPSDASPVASNTGYGVAPDAYPSSLGVGEAVSPDVALAEGASPYAAYGFSEPSIQYGTSPALDALFAESATPAASAIGEGALNLYGAGEAAIPGLAAGETAGGVSSGATGAAGGGSGALAGGLYAIIGEAVKRGMQGAARYSQPTEGVAPGDFFSTDDGNWRPRLAEPDKNFFSQTWGGGSTTGAKFDARAQQGDWGGALKAGPGFVAGYSIPGLEVGQNVAKGYVQRQTGSDRVGNLVGSIIDPVGQSASGFSEVKDIGDAASSLLTGGVINDSHLCTMIKNEIGLTRKEMLMMRLFKNWVEAHHREDHDKYIKLFGRIASKIRSSANGAQEVFMDLKKAVVDSVINLMDKDDMEGAYLTYKGKCLELYQEYGE